MVQKIFKPGDKITIEDVRESMRRAESAGCFYVNENCGVKPVEENCCLVFETEDDSDNAQSLKEFNEIYADFGSCRLNEDIDDTTVSAKGFRTIAMNILEDLYDEETYSHVEGTV